MDDLLQVFPRRHHRVRSGTDLDVTTSPVCAASNDGRDSGGFVRTRRRLGAGDGGDRGDLLRRAHIRPRRPEPVGVVAMTRERPLFFLLAFCACAAVACGRGEEPGRRPRRGCGDRRPSSPGGAGAAGALVFLKARHRAGRLAADQGPETNVEVRLQSTVPRGPPSHGPGQCTSSGDI